MKECKDFNKDDNDCVLCKEAEILFEKMIGYKDNLGPLGAFFLIKNLTDLRKTYTEKQITGILERIDIKITIYETCLN